MTQGKKRKDTSSSVPQRPKRQKTRKKGDVFKDFYNAAWTTILGHYNEVFQSNPDTEEDTREEGTKAVLQTLDVGEIEGASGTANVHAESQAYNAALRKAIADAGEDGDPLELFDTYVGGGSISCAKGKASCFMCAAIAHSLGVEVEHKDLRGFTAYNLPDIFVRSETHFRDLVGATAYGYFQELGTILDGREEQRRIYTSLGSELYARHKGSGGNFKTD